MKNEISATPLHEGVQAGPVLVKVSTADTGGAYCVLEFWFPPGVGAPNHVHHREDEIITVVEGTLTVASNGTDLLEAQAGTVVRLPKGIPHSFRNAHDVPARMLVTAIPGGLDESFAAQAALGRDATRAQIDEVNARYGIEILD